MLPLCMANFKTSPRLGLFHLSLLALRGLSLPYSRLVGSELQRRGVDVCHHTPSWEEISKGKLGFRFLC